MSNGRGARTIVRLNNDHDFNPFMGFRRANEAAANQLVTGLGLSTVGMDSGSGTRLVWNVTPWPVIVRIDSAVTNYRGLYTGTIYNGPMANDGATSFSPPAGMTPGQSCLVENLDEQSGGTTHWLDVSSSRYAEGVIVGASTETPPRPIVRVQRGVYVADGAHALGTAAERLTPDNATWDRTRVTSGTDFGESFTVWVGTGCFYDDAAATPQLKQHMRQLKFAADGRLVSVGAETDYVIDQPDACA